MAQRLPVVFPQGSSEFLTLVVLARFFVGVLMSATSLLDMPKTDCQRRKHVNQRSDSSQNYYRALLVRSLHSTVRMTALIHIAPDSEMSLQFLLRSRQQQQTCTS
jgi:hypothetical protein